MTQKTLVLGGGPTGLEIATELATRDQTVGFVDAPSTSAGAWVKDEFERRHDATLEWVVRDNEFTSFVQRRRQDVDLGADAYVGVTPENLVRANDALGDPHEPVQFG